MGLVPICINIMLVLAPLCMICFAQQPIANQEAPAEKVRSEGEEEIVEFEKTASGHKIDFDKLDTNQDGELIFQELLVGTPEITSVDVQEYIWFIDADNSGTITFQEYADSAAFVQLEDMPSLRNNRLVQEI